MNEIEINSKILNFSPSARHIIREYLRLRGMNKPSEEPIRRIVARNLGYKLDKNKCSEFVYRIIREYNAL